MNEALLETFDKLSPMPSKWGELKQLQRPEESLPKLVAADLEQIMPALLSKYVSNVSKRLNVQPEFVAAPLLSILGGVVGRRFGVRPKLNDTWVTFPCCLWSCISAPPGSRKSPILGEVRRIADFLDDGAADEYADKRKLAEPKLQSLAQKRKAIEKLLFKAHEEANTEEALRLEMQLSMVAVDVERETPKAKRYLTSDSTSAKLAEIMADNPGGLIVFRDELDGLIQSFEQMGNESLRAFYLEAWDGKGRITQDRVSAGTRRAKGIAATLLGSTQPDKLARIASESDDGLIQRFGLLVCMPPQDYDDCDEAPDHASFEQLSRFCQAAAKYDGARAVELRLDEPTRKIFSQWSRENHRSAQDGKLPVALRHHMNKYPAVLCGLACIFEMVAHYSKTGSLSGLESIGVESMQMGAEWIESVFLPHARFVYGRNTAQCSAERLAARISSGQVFDGMSVRTIERKHWEGLSSAAMVRAGLEELEEIGWLRVQKESGVAHRPKETVRLHPDLFKAVQSA